MPLTRSLSVVDAGVALEFDFVFVATLDGGCEGGVDGEQEEVMVTGSS
jgi:hypothetical protein